MELIPIGESALDGLEIIRDEVTGGEEVMVMLPMPEGPGKIHLVWLARTPTPAIHNKTVCGIRNPSEIRLFTGDVLDTLKSLGKRLPLPCDDCARGRRRFL